MCYFTEFRGLQGAQRQPPCKGKRTEQETLPHENLNFSFIYVAQQGETTKTFHQECLFTYWNANTGINQCKNKSSYHNTFYFIF